MSQSLIWVPHIQGYSILAKASFTMSSISPFSPLKKYTQFLIGDFWKPPREEKSSLHKALWQQLFFFWFPSTPSLLSWGYIIQLDSLFVCLIPFPFHFLNQSVSIFPWIFITKIPWNRTELYGLEVGMDSKKRSAGKTGIAFHAKAEGKCWSTEQLRIDSIPS